MPSLRVPIVNVVLAINLSLLNCKLALCPLPLPPPASTFMLPNFALPPSGISKSVVGLPVVRRISKLEAEKSLLRCTTPFRAFRLPILTTPLTLLKSTTAPQIPESRNSSLVPVPSLPITIVPVCFRFWATKSTLPPFPEVPKCVLISTLSSVISPCALKEIFAFFVEAPGVVLSEEFLILIVLPSNIALE
ncbi:hypothetical protein HFN_2467 [Helicobacter fennelliae MRY12-0050]|uniref:Uncharacterized protein n=1 Tax=Helicobacter fennelliae MRY12-0050 TaxID=1325130 RepID=T1CP48_9HELI|nr:hypothetical protein HFN_2467 [Helicobacter fennelliae MRY12-0050]